MKYPVCNGEILSSLCEMTGVKKKKKLVLSKAVSFCYLVYAS